MNDRQKRAGEIVNDIRTLSGVPDTPNDRLAGIFSTAAHAGLKHLGICALGEAVGNVTREMARGTMSGPDQADHPEDRKSFVGIMIVFVRAYAESLGIDADEEERKTLADLEETHAKVLDNVAKGIANHAKH